jgi:hypothetical protein
MILRDDILLPDSGCPICLFRSYGFPGDPLTRHPVHGSGPRVNGRASLQFLKRILKQFLKLKPFFLYSIAILSDILG